jgi:lipoprotein NlpI
MRAERIAQALEDPAKAVRIAAARQLLTLQRRNLPESAGAAAMKASKEWQLSLAAKSDFPETHMALGGAALAMRNVAAAINAFSEVTELDPQLVQAWIMLVQLHWSRRDFSATETTLQKGLAANPGDPNLLELKRQFLAQ